MRISDWSSDVCSSDLFVAALEGTTDVGEVRAIVGDLREACNATGRLLNALLDVSELESGKRGGSSMDFPVQQLLDRMARVYGPPARETGLALRMVPSRQVLHNAPHLPEPIPRNPPYTAVRHRRDHG